MVEPRTTAWLRPFVTLLALAGVLSLAACGGGSGAPNNMFDNPGTVTLQVLPLNTTVYSGVPSTVTITSGTAPFTLFSNNPAILPVTSGPSSSTTIPLLAAAVSAEHAGHGHDPGRDRPDRERRRDGAAVAAPAGLYHDHRQSGLHRLERHAVLRSGRNGHRRRHRRRGRDARRPAGSLRRRAGHLLAGCRELDYACPERYGANRSERIGSGDAARAGQRGDPVRDGACDGRRLGQHRDRPIHDRSVRKRQLGALGDSHGNDNVQRPGYDAMLFRCTGELLHLRRHASVYRCPKLPGFCEPAGLAGAVKRRSIHRGLEWLLLHRPDVCDNRFCRPDVTDAAAGGQRPRHSRTAAPTSSSPRRGSPSRFHRRLPATLARRSSSSPPGERAPTTRQLPFRAGIPRLP